MCDTFIALAPATKDGSVVFAKNSDRPAGEGQCTRHYRAACHDARDALQCTYIKIPQVRRTHAILLSQIDWMWGGEMGANEHGVVIGNEAVWTKVQPGPPALLGMDLLRLGLERGASAREALDVIVSLLREFGQGGACAQNDPGFTYDNSYLIADAGEAWILETAGRAWAAKRITSGNANISNRLSLRADYDICCQDLRERAAAQGLAGAEGPVDFAATFSIAPLDREPGSRESQGAHLLAQNAGCITPETMKEILRDHESGICMHGAFETTASMVSRLSPGAEATHWLSDGPGPCRASFQRFDGLVPARAPMRAG